MDYRKRIGKAIIHLRGARGFSQERLAYEANIDRRYMSDIENGKRNISIDILSRIADFFEMPLSELLALAEKVAENNDGH